MYYTYGTDIQMTSEPDKKQTITITGHDMVPCPQYRQCHLPNGTHTTGYESSYKQTKVRFSVQYITVSRSRSEKEHVNYYLIPDNF